MKNTFYVLLLVSIFTITGCSSDDDDVSNENAPIAEFEIFGTPQIIALEESFISIRSGNKRDFSLQGFLSGSSNPFSLRLEMYIDQDNPPNETTFLANNTLEVNTFDSDSFFSYTLPCTNDGIEGETCGTKSGILSNGTIIVTLLSENTYKMIINASTDDGDQLKGMFIQTFTVD
ncbi:hypothetical protein [Aquimarina sp. SS2-1]|uniref:hypothetical protein n=1 Tax=Aquimarina besae TaxID=3342247 RepID=UPI00366F31FA